jgi:predicted transcriptional regulator
MGLIVVPLWFMALALAWYVNRQTLLQKARIEEWKAEAAGDRVALAWRVGADHSVST